MSWLLRGVRLQSVTKNGKTLDFFTSVCEKQEGLFRAVGPAPAYILLILLSGVMPV